jgi:hypothetical protein
MRRTIPRLRQEDRGEEGGGRDTGAGWCSEAAAADDGRSAPPEVQEDRHGTLTNGTISLAEQLVLHKSQGKYVDDARVAAHLEARFEALDLQDGDGGSRWQYMDNAGLGELHVELEAEAAEAAAGEIAKTQAGAGVEAGVGQAPQDESASAISGMIAPA